MKGSRYVFKIDREACSNYTWAAYYLWKNVKFEDYAEIHGLCSKGLKFGVMLQLGGRL